MPFRISEPSYQSLFLEAVSLGNQIGTATGFIATSSTGVNFLVTNRHVVTGRDQHTGNALSNTLAVPDTLRISHNSRGDLGQFVKVDEPLFDGEAPRWIEHSILGAAADIVALPISDRDDIALYPYRINYFAHMFIEPARRVSVVGFPFGERTGSSFAIWATGFVASEPEIDHGGRPVFLIDCRTRPGQSGSPVISYQNGGGILLHENGTEVNSPICELLGVYSGRINNESDLGIVWKTDTISELLDVAAAATH